uniref:sec-independent protein translocase protein TATB, chloroplastic-like isoform X2 n=1 Tax=Erigeron canadensis TaxID=72917 RepID=UPI001CB91774|nr:sec-independent protein translocase protein TATB, chloroplastic-like isoform X2 [Erigeron canadensis]
MASATFIHPSSSYTLPTVSKSSHFSVSIFASPVSYSKNPTFSSLTVVPQLGLSSFSTWNGLKSNGVSILLKSFKFEKKRKCGGKGVFASLFGVGAPEALVIGVVALLVFGPKGLAEIAKGAGKTLRTFQPTIRELQEVSREFKSTLEKEIGLDELKNPSQLNTSNQPTMSSAPTSFATPENSQAVATETATAATTGDSRAATPIVETNEDSQVTATPLAATNEDSQATASLLSVTNDDSQATATSPAAPNEDSQATTAQFTAPAGNSQAVATTPAATMTTEPNSVQEVAVGSEV